LQTAAIEVTVIGTNKISHEIYGADNREMMNITSLERDGCDLVIRGKLFGAMPLTAKLRPEDARAALRLLNFSHRAVPADAAIPPQTLLSTARS